MKKIILIALFLFPTLALAEMPAFPMAFYGSVTINDSPAPVGTIIRAYYEDVNPNNLAGEATIKETGIYGYALSTGQKLLVKEGAGKIIFTFQFQSILSGQETKGINEISYASFESESTKEFNIAFKYDVPVPPVPPTPPSGGGGGGGGGGGSRGSTSRTIPILPSQASAVAQANVGRTGSVLGASIFVFNSNLAIGSSGNDVTELQNRLTTEGVYTGPITGYFGPLTMAGVKAFQLKYGIEQVGIVGPATRARLNQGSGTVLGAQTSMTMEQMKALLSQLQAQVAALLLKLNSLSR